MLRRQKLLSSSTTLEPALNPLKMHPPQCYSFRSERWLLRCTSFSEPADSGSPQLFLTAKRGEPDRISIGQSESGLGDSHRLAQPATATARNGQNASTVAGLARFFPEASPVRVPVQLARILQRGDTAAAHFSEGIVIEFGTPREVLFECNTPLEFGDDLRLRNSDRSFDVAVSVVAVQYHPGKTVVAARFQGEVPNWIVKS